MAGFVDIHSHVCPSGDDGARTLDEGAALCALAAAHGTTLLFATPHVWPHLKLTPEREAAVRAAHAALAAGAGLELRLGWELRPSSGLLREDPARYVLGGTRCVLVEVPFQGSLDVLVAVAEHVEANGLVPVVAHPERGDAVIHDPALARELASRGWPLQVNAGSLTGEEGPRVEALAWSLVGDGLASLVASDGHALRVRAPVLDTARDVVVARLGEEAAAPLFDGSALLRAVP